MTDATQNGCMMYVPTWRDRLWRKLGFVFHLGDEPDDGREKMPGWEMIETRFRFGFLDRLRLLATGHLRVRTVSHTDTPSPSVMLTRVDWKILAPGEKD